MGMRGRRHRRALDYLFLNVQQRSDGSFPQNTKVDGTPIFHNLQLDEVSDPIILAYQLGRKDRSTWSRHIKPAANYILNFAPLIGWVLRRILGKRGGKNRAGILPRLLLVKLLPWCALPILRRQMVIQIRRNAISQRPMLGSQKSRSGR